MKRALVVFVLLIACAGCASGRGRPGVPLRAETLPDGFVAGVAGAPMKLAFDRLDEKKGYAGWAWEEDEGGAPKLLLVEIWACPADCEALYEQALEGAEPIGAPVGAEACWDGRAAHMKAGGCFARIVTMGFPEEEYALEMLATKLAYGLSPEG